MKVLIKIVILCSLLYSCRNENTLYSWQLEVTYFDNTVDTINCSKDHTSRFVGEPYIYFDAGGFLGSDPSPCIKIIYGLNEYTVCCNVKKYRDLSFNKIPL